VYEREPTRCWRRPERSSEASITSSAASDGSRSSATSAVRWFSYGCWSAQKIVACRPLVALMFHKLCVANC
jgi:hypothetical protein